MRRIDFSTQEAPMAHRANPVLLADQAQHPPETLRSQALALAGLSTVFLFEMLDNSILNVALPTIARDLHASATELQWVTGGYAVVFGSLMIPFGVLSDRVGRRRVMLIGLALLGVSSLATALVQSAWMLIAVRAAMGVAAAMTTPGSLALAFRLFRSDDARVRATTLISTVGLVGLAVGPSLGGLVLALWPWQTLLIANAPIAALAWVGIRFGIPADDPAELHQAPLDALGALLGSAAVTLLLVSPTVFVSTGGGSLCPWAFLAGAVAAGTAFVARARRIKHPIVDLALVARPLVSSGLLYKAATGLASAGLSYFVTLQLQLAWGWSPVWAAIGMLPQVVVLLAGGMITAPIVRRLGLDRVAWLSAAAVVAACDLRARGTLWVPVCCAFTRSRRPRHPAERCRCGHQRHARDARKPHDPRRIPRGHLKRARDWSGGRSCRNCACRSVHRQPCGFGVVAPAAIAI